MRALVTSFLVAVLLIVPVSVGSQALAEEEAGTFEVILKQGVGVEELLRTAADTLNLPLVWDPNTKNIRGRQVTGNVALRGSREEVHAALRSLLTFYDLVMVPVGTAPNNVILVTDGRYHGAVLKIKPEYVELNDSNLATYEKQDGKFLTTTIRVEHMTDLRNARNALTRLVTQQNIGSVTEVPSAKAFVVTDFAPNVVAIYRLLRQMDSPTAGSTTTAGTLRTIQLKHAKAEEVEAMLRNHFHTRTPAAKPGTRQGYSAAVARAPRIDADPRTNQLLVSGTTDQVQRVVEAITALDVPKSESKLSAYYMRLSHIRADEAAMALQRLIQSSPALWREAGHAGLAPSVVAHDATNALLISASEKAYVKIRRFIEEMDAADPEKQAADK